MEIIKNIILLPLLIFFPIYFWGYIFSLLGENIKGLRARFFMGSLLGLFSVGVLFFLTQFLQDFSVWISSGIILAFLLLVYVLILVITKNRNRLVALFIRRTSLLHAFLVFGFFILFFTFAFYFSKDFLLLTSLLALFFSAFFEEIAKHFTLIGLMGRYYSFSLRDLTIFSFCIVLGFVFVENLLYLFLYKFSIGLTLSRSIFSFSAHLFSVMLATLFWWKALSFSFFSWRYMYYFISGLSLSVISHTLFNYFASTSQNIFLLLYPLGAYGLFVYGFKK